MSECYGRCGRLARATRGAVFVEHIIAFVPVLYFGLLVWQLLELCVGDLVVRRAASAAARAAVVVLPDNPDFYGGAETNSFTGERKTDIELAAALVLATNPHFRDRHTVIVEGAPDGAVDVSRNASSWDKFDIFAGIAGMNPGLIAKGAVGVVEAGKVGPGAHGPLSVTVVAPFTCFAAWVNLVCGGGTRNLHATVTYPYQGAAYEY